jgi:hypothetical protein
MSGVTAQSGFAVSERDDSKRVRSEGFGGHVTTLPAGYTPWHGRSKKRDSNGLTQLHRDVLAYIDGRTSVDYCDIAAHFGFSPPRACRLINILAQRGMLIRSIMVLTPLGVSARS